ncbi:MAG: IS110 family transposase [Syntrophomonadaceae bacterium]|nr:IS110 family transposase [Syntrophomonadaceae bacterium]
MDAILESCAGLDVHQETVVACVLFGPLDNKPNKEIKTFSTLTNDLLALADWLDKHNCSHVAMESTGVYWKPVWNILESCSFKLILTNAQRIKNVPGRKTDIKDAEWIAQLLRSGLVECSFVPPTEIRDLRDLTRYRKKLIQDATQEKNRIHKILQDANIKITSYLSDIFGVSGRNIIESVINGERITPEKISLMVKGQVKNKVPQLVDALNGRLRRHHRDMMRFSWNHLMYLEKTVADIEEQIDQCLSPYRQEIELIKSIPGINSKAAAVLLAEIGADMSVFPTDKHLSSWAGVSPGNNESAGKKKRSRAKPGNKALKAILCECAWASSKKRNSRLSACYWRWVKRMGIKKALIALAHLLLRIVYQILLTKTPYQELGPEYLENREIQKELRLIKLLESKGYQITKAG